MEGLRYSGSIEHGRQKERSNSLDANKILVELNYSKWYAAAPDKDYLQNAILEILLAESIIDEQLAKRIITKWQLRATEYRKMHEYAHTSIETDNNITAQ